MAEEEEDNEFKLVSYFGLGIIYYKGRKHGVGVIAPQLLPIKSLRYRIHFSFLFQTPSTSGFFIPLPSGSLLGSFYSFDSSVQKKSYVFDLRFLNSRPRFNTIIKATQEDVDNGFLQTTNNILMVAYVVKLTANTEDGEIFSITDANEDIPGAPDDASIHEDDYFNYFYSFTDSATVAGDVDSTTNIFDELLKCPGNEFRFKRSRLFERDGTSNRIGVKGDIEKDQYYAITYEEVTEYVYAQFHQIIMEILSIGLVLSVDFNFPTVKAYSPMYFYQYKEWTSPEGEAMKGWRISEAYNGPNNAYIYDDSGNVKTDPTSTLEHVFYNMVEGSLQKRDEERIAYQDRIVEVYLEDAKVNGASSTDEDFDPDALTSSTVRTDNFEIYQSNEKRIVGGTYTNPESNVVFEETANVTLEYSGGKQFAYWDSDIHFKSFGKNTRMILAFDTGISTQTVLTMSSQKDVNVLSQSSAQDPLYFGIIDGKLNYYVFGDSSFGLDLPAFVQHSLDRREKEFGASVHMGSEHDGVTGQSILLDKYSYQTYIDDSEVDATPESPDQVTNNVFLVLDDVTPSDVASADEALGFSVDSEEIISSIEFTPIPTIYDNPIKIRGWAREPDELGKQALSKDDTPPVYELSKIYFGENVSSVLVSGWTNISYIEVLGGGLSVNKYQIMNQEGSPENFIKDADSVACMAGKRGTFSCYYTTSGGRMGLLISNDFGGTWINYVNIFMRGGRMSSLRSVINEDSDRMKLFHYYKDSIVMVEVPVSVVNYDIDNKSTEAEILDQIRTSQSFLVIGDIDKDEGIAHNILLETSDLDTYMETRKDPESILDEETGDVSIFDLSKSNRFILVGPNSTDSILSRQDAPKDADYTVYENNRGVIRLLMVTDDEYIRCLTSSDGGGDWVDLWDVTLESSIVKINSLKPLGDEEIDEAKNITAIYNSIERRVYLFYFYENCLLVKSIDELIFYDTVIADGEIDKVKSQELLASKVNAMPIHFVAGEIGNVLGYAFDAEEEVVPPGEDDPISNLSKIYFGDFQLEESSVERFYNESNYVSQSITGYTTNKGYMRVFLVNNKKVIDSYYYDGHQWYPENVMLVPTDTQ